MTWAESLLDATWFDFGRFRLEFAFFSVGFGWWWFLCSCWLRGVIYASLSVSYGVWASWVSFRLGLLLGLFRLLWSSVAGIFQRLGDQEDPLFFYCGCVQFCSIVAVGLEKMARITLKMILQHWLNIEWWHSAAIVLMGSKPFFGMHFIHQQLHLKNPNTWDAQAIGILSCSCNNIIYSMNLVFNMLKVIRTPSPGT